LQSGDQFTPWMDVDPLRLHSRYARLLARGKNKQQTVTAIARELVGFVWAIAQQRDLLAA
jgi:hypothetical protein